MKSRPFYGEAWLRSDCHSARRAQTSPLLADIGRDRAAWGEETSVHAIGYGFATC